MNYRWCEISKGAVHYYQSAFDTSTIVAQLSEHNNILKNHIKAISINDENSLLCSSMRATGKEHTQENRSVITE